MGSVKDSEPYFLRDLSNGHTYGSENDRAFKKLVHLIILNKIICLI